jgi:hypothetical protein
MNKLGYILAGMTYILLSLAYVFRGSIRIGKFVYQIEHRHMQLVVSVLYMSLGYLYIVDGVYDQFEDAFEIEENINENKNHKKSKEKKLKYIKLLIYYIFLVFITIYVGKRYISMEKKK